MLNAVRFARLNMRLLRLEGPRRLLLLFRGLAYGVTIAVEACLRLVGNFLAINKLRYRIFQISDRQQALFLACGFHLFMLTTHGVLIELATVAKLIRVEYTQLLRVMYETERVYLGVI